MDTDNFASMSDAQLDEMIEAQEAETTTDTGTDDVQPDAVETIADPPAEQTDAQQATPNADPNWNPDGPGDTKVALQQARERARQAEARLAEIDAANQRAAFEQQEAQRQAALHERLANTFDPDEQADILRQVQQTERQNARDYVTQQETSLRLNLSVESLRETAADYDAVVDAALANPDVKPLILAAADAALKLPAGTPGSNPALAAYKLAQRLSPAAEQARIDKAVALALAKHSSPPNQGHTTIGHVASSAQSKEPPKDPRKMTDAELHAATHGL